MAEWISKKEQGEDLARQLSMMLNRRDNEALMALMKAMLNEHRFLQNEFNSWILTYLVRCSKMYDEGMYDGRNA